MCIRDRNINNYEHEQAKNILEVNLGGFVNFIVTILPYLKARKQGHIVCVGSIAGYFGMANNMTYGASKAGMINLTESLHLELKKLGVKVQLVNPGFVKTRLTDQNNFKMPFLISPQKAAEIIAKDMSKNKFEIHFPWQMSWSFKVIRKLPSRIKLWLLGKI